MADDEHDTRATIDTETSGQPVPPRAVEVTTACLVVIYGADLGRRIPLDVPAIECGRSLQIGIPLEDDSASRRHARFAWAGSNFIVSDLGSTNGTYVNDVSVREKVLRDGDQIKIGHTIFKFIFGGHVEQSYHEEIYRLMTIDGLTEVHNKRSFETSFEREVSRSHRYRRPLSLALFDLDHFKRINDSCGHLAGDAVLRQLAALVNSSIRREDTLARVGGEEFALIAPELNLAEARAMAEKVRALVERTPCHFEGRAIPLTVSFGVAELPLEQPPNPVALYRAADERLYAAKRAGRNRVS